MTARVVSILLAAGKGVRLGGPKALLLWPTARLSDPRSPPAAGSGPSHGELPLAIAHAEARLAAESSRVLIVVRSPIIRALLAYARPGIDFLASDMADDLGPAGSIAFAARRLDDADIALITPVDTPPSRAETTARLLAALTLTSAPPPLAVRPRLGGRAGHPVLMRVSALEPYRGPSPPVLRDHLRALGPRCVDVDVDDRNALIDLNTPADVVGLLGSPPRFLAA
jgi:molybdenum cofactor cytidylyltransferase